MLLSDFIEELKTYQDMYGDVEVMQEQDGTFFCITGAEIVNVSPSCLYDGEFFRASENEYSENAIVIG